MAIIGSHNSMTYAKSKNWIMNLFSFFWKCQNNSIIEQFENGARCFDLRIRLKFPDKNPNLMINDWVFVHGSCEFKNYEFISQMNLLNSLAVNNNETLYIRLILDEDEENLSQESGFIELCTSLQNRYNALNFFGGYRKFDNKLLYRFKYQLNVVQYVGSTQSWYGKLWPLLYWKLNHKENLEQLKNYDDNTIVLFDFI